LDWLQIFSGKSKLAEEIVGDRIPPNVARVHQRGAGCPVDGDGEVTTIFDRGPTEVAIVVLALELGDVGNKELKLVEFFFYWPDSMIRPP
jgi:hypothetical protein